jgi:uncharacterized phage-associated protein
VIRFQFSVEKFVNAVAYFAERRPGLTKLEVCKLLFFADKEHLVKYGRPVTGDHYWRLQHGPVPTRGLDLLRGKGSRAELALLDKHVTVEGRSIRLKAPASKGAFSKSDLAVLDQVLKECAGVGAARLRELSHKERAYQEAKEKAPMDFELFFGGDATGQRMKELVIENQEARRALAPYRA